MSKIFPCPKCGRATRLQSEWLGIQRPKNGPPDWPLHIFNMAAGCNASSKHGETA